MKQNWLMEEHDKLAQRLGMILTKLNAGEHLQIASLAQEFNVSERTIQRDLNKRLSYLPLEREGQVYWLAPNYLGKNTTASFIERQQSTVQCIAQTLPFGIAAKTGHQLHLPQETGN